LLESHRDGVRVESSQRGSLVGSTAYVSALMVR
jgi:hypothetical protein